MRENRAAALAFVIVLALIGALLALRPAPPPPPKLNEPPKQSVKPPKLTTPPGKDDYPRTDGAATTQFIGQLSAYKLFGIAYEWSVDEHGARWLGLKDYAALADLSKRRVTLPQSGAKEAYERLIRGRVDVIFEDRKPTEEEVATAAKRDVEFEVEPVALDALVFLVHSGNPVKGLTMQQVRDVCTGKLKNWKDAGGPDKPITLHHPAINSGARDLLSALVMKGEKFAVGAPDEAAPAEAPALLTRLSQDEGGLAYCARHAVDLTRAAKSLRTLEIDGVDPSVEAIRARKYPCAFDVYVVMDFYEPVDSPARRLREWLLGNEGQGALVEAGYVTRGGSGGRM